MSTVILTIPQERLTCSKMTPAGRGRGEGSGTKGYKGLESQLVDESDKKFIRQFVGRRRRRHRLVVGVVNREKGRERER